MKAGDLSGPEDFVNEMLGVTLRNLRFEYEDKAGALTLYGAFLIDLPFLGLWHAEATYSKPAKNDNTGKKTEW